MSPVDEERAKVAPFPRPASTHPLVWTRRSGRRSLVIGVHADHVAGLGLDEGRAVLRELLDRTTAPESR